MEKVFIGKNNKPYSIGELEIANILYNDALLNGYSMAELDALYKKYFGDYGYVYPYILEAKIKLYDKSINVNSFLISGKSFWLDKNTRIGLMHLANCSTDNILLVLGEQILTIPVDAAKNFLQQLEVYAGLCYLQTQKHLIAAKDLKTIEDIINYDYTKGYPDKLNLDEYIDLA